MKEPLSTWRSKLRSGAVGVDELLDLHLAVSHERGLTVYDACPDLATHEAFVAGPEFRGAIAQVGLPTPTVEVIGEVCLAHFSRRVVQ